MIALTTIGYVDFRVYLRRSSTLSGQERGLGAADGPVKTAIFGSNSAKMYNYTQTRAELETNGVAQVKHAYLRDGANPSNTRYGFVLGETALG
jgi:hypothetical protein